MKIKFIFNNGTCISHTLKSNVAFLFHFLHKCLKMEKRAFLANDEVLIHTYSSEGTLLRLVERIVEMEKDVTLREYGFFLYFFSLPTQVISLIDINNFKCNKIAQGIDTFVTLNRRELDSLVPLNLNWSRDPFAQFNVLYEFDRHYETLLCEVPRFFLILSNEDDNDAAAECVCCWHVWCRMHLRFASTLIRREELPPLFFPFYSCGVYSCRLNDDDEQQFYLLFQKTTLIFFHDKDFVEIRLSNVSNFAIDIPRRTLGLTLINNHLFNIVFSTDSLLKNVVENIRELTTRMLGEITRKFIYS